MTLSCSYAMLFGWFLWQDLQGIEEVEILPRRPSQKVVTYLLRMGDERILAPLAAFFPDMFGLQGEQLFHRTEKFVSDPTDPNDDDYLERTMSRHELVRLMATANFQQQN